MRVAVISDVHANYHALEAVLEQIDGERVDAVWCLGDTVGYGPMPNECCDAVRARADRCLVGNHDLVALGELSVSDFNDEAAAAALWTSTVLTHESRRFLESLKPAGEAEGIDLFHASARDPVWEYVLTEEAARATLELSDAPLVLVGHSHVALAITLDGDRVLGGLAPGGAEVELEGRWLLNPGSVGQPRDGDPRAAWVVLDLERRSAAFRRVPYSIRQTQEEIRERGLPGTLAARLARGE
jgi:predicted phosphodiesterase